MHWFEASHVNQQLVFYTHFVSVTLKWSSSYMHHTPHIYITINVHHYNRAIAICTIRVWWYECELLRGKKMPTTTIQWSYSHTHKRTKNETIVYSSYPIYCACICICCYHLLTNWFSNCLLLWLAFCRWCEVPEDY